MNSQHPKNILDRINRRGSLPPKNRIMECKQYPTIKMVPSQNSFKRNINIHGFC